MSVRGKMSLRYIFAEQKHSVTAIINQSFLNGTPRKLLVLGLIYLFIVYLCCSNILIIIVNDEGGCGNLIHYLVTIILV